MKTIGELQSELYGKYPPAGDDAAMLEIMWEILERLDVLIQEIRFVKVGGSG